MKFLRITRLISGLIACLGVMLCMHGCGAPAPPLTEAELTAKIEKEEKELESQKEQWAHVSGLLTDVRFKGKQANSDSFVLLEFEDGRVAILEKDSCLPLVFHVGLVNEVWYDKEYGTIKRVKFETPLRREE